MTDDLRRAAEQACEFIDVVPVDGVYSPAGAAECWVHLKRLAKAYRAAVAAERAWAAGVADAEAVRHKADGDAAGHSMVYAVCYARHDVAADIAAAIRRGPEPTEGV